MAQSISEITVAVMNSKYFSPSVLLHFLLPVALAGLHLPAALAGAPAFAPAEVQQHPAASGGAAADPCGPQQVAVSDEVRREEAAGERRLSASELAELRQQVRQQWASAPEAAARVSESSSAERMLPGQAAKGAAAPAPRGPRP